MRIIATQPDAIMKEQPLLHPDVDSRAANPDSKDSVLMLVLSKRQVTDYRIRRQMLAPNAKGYGRAGTLAALRLLQPAPQGNHWLTARMATPDAH